MRRALSTVVVVLSLTALWSGGPASAACHAFTVTADPSTVDEGGTVTLTIRRDAAVNPSSVRVRTVDGTATGGSDYQPLDERVSFTTETEQTRTVTILDDTLDEADETFTVELSEGQGCEVNPNFSYGSATITIRDDDAPAPTPSPTETAPTPTTPAPSPTASPGQVDGLPTTGGGVLAGIAVLLVAGAALLRRR